MGGVSSLGLMACERSVYRREEEQKDDILDLGPVRNLLYTQIHIPIKSVLLFRDIDGWSAISTRCSYNGCDLTFQEPTLFCPCCQSSFSLEGNPYAGGSATVPLPWLELSYKEGHLYAHPGKVVPKKNRFTTPEIEAAIRKLKLQIRDPSIASEARIPDAVMGGQNREEDGPMFVDGVPDLAEP